MKLFEVAYLAPDKQMIPIRQVFAGSPENRSRTPARWAPKWCEIAPAFVAAQLLRPGFQIPRKGGELSVGQQVSPTIKMRVGDPIADNVDQLLQACAVVRLL